MQASSENHDQPGSIELGVAVGSHGVVRLTASTATKSIQAGLSPWDAEALADQLRAGAARAREILASN